MKKQTKALENPAMEENTSPEESAMPQESKGRKIANTILNVVLVIAIVIAAVCTYVSFVSTSGNGVPSILGVRIFSIQTESMYPVLSPGDLIFDVGVKDASTLKVDDIITYWTVIDGERVLNTHKIVEIYDGGNYRIFSTKGENNTIADPLTVHESEVVGKFSGVKINGLGKVFDYLQTSTGFLLVVVVPVAIYFLYHLIHFFRVLFEYQNIKNKLMYEQERGKNEDIMDEEKRKLEQTRQVERQRLEAELREKLRQEILAAGVQPQAPPAQEPAAQEQSEEELRAAMEAEIRAKLMAEAEAKKKAEEEARKKEAAKAAMEAEIRAKIMAEMEAAQAQKPAAPAEAEAPSAEKTEE